MCLSIHMCHAQNMAGHPSHGNPYMRGIKIPGLMINLQWEKIQYPTNSTMAAMAPLPSAGTSVLLSPGSTWPFSTPPFFHGSCCIILNWRPSWSPQPQVLHAHVAGALMFTEVKSQVGILSILEPTRTSEVHFRLVYFSGWPENYGTAGETLQFDTIWLNDASSWNLRLTAQG